MWKLNNIHLSNQWVKEAITREMRIAGEKWK